VYHDCIEVTLQQDDDSDAGAASSPSTISIPFVPTLPLRKGVVPSPTRRSAMDEARRISLLTAVARSRHWIETILKHPALDFGAIGKHEKLAERHVRFLAPLAYLSPRII
jgi:site-specific DNA recombinase